MTSLEIEPADIIRLIQQYLKENNLSKALQSLQNETDVSLNTVDSVDTFVNDINSGRWDVVLRAVKLLKLPDDKLIDLYEQIAIELIELRETRAANWIIHKTEPMQKLKSYFPDRYVQLQNLLDKSFFDYKETYRDGNTKERRRNNIAQALKKEVTVVPPQRLLELISDALKWKKHEGLLPSGSSIDIFTGKTKMFEREDETHPNTLHRHCIKPLNNPDDPEGAIMVCCAEFSPDGNHLVVGYSTGLIEIRNPTTGRIAYDLKYQATRDFIITPGKTAALSLCFSNVSECIAIGDRSGDISVWSLETGELILVFKSAHSKGVTSLQFHRNGKEILSGGHDGCVKLSGMRSNKTIRDFRGHRSFVYGVTFSRDDNFIISGGIDSTVKIWNSRTAQLLHEYKCSSKIHTLCLMTNFKNDIFLVGTRSDTVYLVDLEAKVRSKLVFNYEEDHEAEEKTNQVQESSMSTEDIVDTLDEKATSGDDQISFQSACASPKGNWIYAVDSNNIYCLNYATKRVQKKLAAHECDSEHDPNDLIGVKHHPYLNLLATYDIKGNLKLWKP